MIYTLSVIIIIVLVEVLIRTVVKKAEEKRTKEQRQKILDESLTKDFSKISSSLKRVELQNPLARILIVDKDESMLDRLRSMLVLDGYSVDSVTSGSEAHQLTLLNHYDFVFTGEHTRDLSGQELLHKIHERRPDMDVIIITEESGSATPYDLIKEGAIDFIQKPYVDNRLNEFVRTHIARRREKIQKELEKNIKSSTKTELIPGGYFITKNHIWGYIEENGFIRFGLDKFAFRFFGVIDTIDFANLNIQLSKENPIFIVKKKYNDVYFNSPIEGKVVAANVKIRENLSELSRKPYLHWICKIDPDNLKDIFPEVLFGKNADEYIKSDCEALKEEIKNLSIQINEEKDIASQLNDEQFIYLVNKFFKKQ